MVKKIALEEHFLCPGFEDYWKPTVGNVDPREYRAGAGASHRFRRDASCGDGQGRDRARGAVGRRDPACRPSATPPPQSARRARPTIFWRSEIAEAPGPLFRLCPSGDAGRARRCRRARALHARAQICGAMINGHTNGQYLDHPVALSVLGAGRGTGRRRSICIPPIPLTPAPVLEGHKGLRRATWEWGFETGSHALRLVFGGHFDRFPRAKLALGHLGETLPFLLWRFDSRAKLYGVKLAKPPSQYIKREHRGHDARACARPSRLTARSPRSATTT